MTFSASHLLNRNPCLPVPTGPAIGILVCYSFLPPSVCINHSLKTVTLIIAGKQVVRNWATPIMELRMQNHLTRAHRIEERY